MTSLIGTTTIMNNHGYIDAGGLAELAPGSMKRVNGFGERILIANDAGMVHAVSDTCSHEDASLSLGALKPGTISCPLHGSRFCLKSGVPLDEPAEIPIRVYRVEIVDNRIMVSR